MARRDSGWSVVMTPTPFVFSERFSSAGISASGPMPSSGTILHSATNGSVAAKSAMLSMTSRMKALCPNGIRNSRCAGRKGRTSIPSEGR
jgi:hypothetical protein